MTFEKLNTPKFREVAKHIQRMLISCGVLDPPFSGSTTYKFRPNVGTVDGIIGLDTGGAIVRFFDSVANVVDTGFEFGIITPEQLDFMSDPSTKDLFPMNCTPTGGDDAEKLFLKKVVKYMISDGQFISRGPDSYNITYIEGVNDDGTLNDDAENLFNDRRIVFSIDKDGVPRLQMNVPATTEPGRYYTNRPLNRKGAARIAFGQYKAWVDGFHNGNQPALVQRGLIKVHRDGNKDGKRSQKDPIDIGRSFGINQHTTSESHTPSTVGRYSAGCLVGQKFASHLDFMQLCRKDFRYINNRGYLFISSVISGTDLNK